MGNNVLLSVTRGTLLMDNSVLLAVTRLVRLVKSTFESKAKASKLIEICLAVSMSLPATNRALFVAKAFVNLSSADDSLVSAVNIDVLDLIVLTKFNISAWNINSSDVAVTVSMADTVRMTVAVLSETRSMLIALTAADALSKVQ